MAEPTESGFPVSPSMPGLPPPPRSKTAPPLPPPERQKQRSPLSTNPTSPIAKDDAHATPDQQSAEDPLALRRTTSAMSSGSSSSRTNREKKRLRFTPVAQENGLELDLLASDLDDAEEGTGRRLVKGKGVARDQADYLKSDPGTPNLSETYISRSLTKSLADSSERIRYGGPCLSQI
jgi:hypothetical protein